MSDPTNSGVQSDDTRAWLVQRRLPGAQGENGCFQDSGTFVAKTADDAMRACAEKLDEHMVAGGYFRVAPAQVWRVFRPTVETTRSVNIHV